MLIHASKRLKLRVLTANHSFTPIIHALRSLYVIFVVSIVFSAFFCIRYNITIMIFDFTPT